MNWFYIVRTSLRKLNIRITRSDVNPCFWLFNLDLTYFENKEKLMLTVHLLRTSTYNTRMKKSFTQYKMGWKHKKMKILKKQMVTMEARLKMKKMINKSKQIDPRREIEQVRMVTKKRRKLKCNEKRYVD